MQGLCDQKWFSFKTSSIIKSIDADNDAAE